MTYSGIAESLETLERNDLMRRVELMRQAEFIGEDGEIYIDMRKFMPFRRPMRTVDTKTA